MRYGAFLRAVNVGGTGKLPMADLRSMCTACGFADVTTYIASGNVALHHDGPAHQVKSRLEDALAEYAGKPVAVMVRTGDALAQIIADNPFPQAPGNRVIVQLLEDTPTSDMLRDLRGHKDEQVAPGAHEIYVHFPSGQGRSKLVMPGAATGTGRNFNTITKMAALVRR